MAPWGVGIRPIRASDLQLTQEFAQSLSARTRYLRFFSTRPLTRDELRRFTDIDASREAALVAVTRFHGVEREVGIARFVQSGLHSDAEFAIVVGDEWRRRGVARALMCALIATAKERGLNRLVGTVLSENSPMLKLARELGFRSWREPGNAGVTEMALDLHLPNLH